MFYQEILEIYGCNYTVTYNQQNHQDVPCDRQQILPVFKWISVQIGPSAEATQTQENDINLRV